MRDKLYLISFLLGAGLLFYLGRGLVGRSVFATWVLTFTGATAAAVLAVVLYRVQLELRKSRGELALRQAELNFALEVQQALFPRSFPKDRGLEFDAVCVPASGIGGDYFDVLNLSNGRVAFALADISGKGISAAILMSNLHAALRVQSKSGSPPGELSSSLNCHLHDVTNGARFATLFYAEWDAAKQCLNYVNAGHLTPLLFGSLRGQKLLKGGPPVGLFPGTDFESGSIRLERGDLLALYSDGITEAGALRKGELFGAERLETLIEEYRHTPLHEIRTRVVDAVRNWVGTGPEDDMTLLLVRVGDGRKAAI